MKASKYYPQKEVLEALGIHHSKKEKAWLNCRECAKRLGVSELRVRELAKQGFIGLQLLPGCSPKYSAKDADLLARASVLPATQRADRTIRKPRASEDHTNPSSAA